MEHLDSFQPGDNLSFIIDKRDLLGYEAMEEEAQDVFDQGALTTLFYELHQDLVLKCRATEEGLEVMHRAYCLPIQPKVSDDFFYSALVKTIFYSGFRPTVIDRYLPTVNRYFSDYQEVMTYTRAHVDEIMQDPGMIKNRSKIMACYNNAWTVSTIGLHCGSMQGFLDVLNDDYSNESLAHLWEGLQLHFDFMGEITALNLMAELGFDVFRPNRELMRGFRRLGLIETEKDHINAVKAARVISEGTRLPLYYITAVVQIYGQMH
ncbi:DNA-3-methyladenine glycosylase I [Acidaminobacter hydrogenoformans]|uniref:DNA-3-methyladenine glycosylase I n=1 Tax=Acidaminobacter hydrogenoformans DSM 2784 TaxID=1120920 RepID=A0A1G5RVI1_9FIRM|nr:DNA-3-methyladenine glycosylase I [Acidaminobacter hydrogenoformans]SCZ78122.1 DNA-3-methyladenine glycosylase I [Acidaminobacter hydrogenoformans DSM 2784]